MAVEGCYKCMKYVLMIFNIIVLLIGAVVLGLGIYIIVADYGVNKISVILGGDDLYESGVILLIVGGAVTIIISFCGCCGAWKENRILLGIYFVVMLLLTIFYVAIVVIGFIFRDNITGHLRREAETSLVNKYGESKSKAVTERWNAIQQELECCGLTGDKNSNTSWAIYKFRTLWFKDRDYNENPGTQYVPESCCKKDNTDMCVGRTNSTGRPPAQGPPVDNLLPNEGLYTDGCYDKLEDFLDENAAIIGGIAIAALIIMLMGVLFSVCLCTQIGKQGYVV
ncbi:hypothetical protein BaRGS_00018356 [Batillaria attramentaria]|uniref:Tetraspanin n=1 Tax=Batillaria attramentaria TaxID=370345 RepID=A0ABD0KUB3_9CAEN